MRGHRRQPQDVAIWQTGHAAAGRPDWQSRAWSSSVAWPLGSTLWLIERLWKLAACCIAVLPSPLDNIVPVDNRRLARAISRQRRGAGQRISAGRDTAKAEFHCPQPLDVRPGRGRPYHRGQRKERRAVYRQLRHSTRQEMCWPCLAISIVQGSVGANNLIKSSRPGLATYLQRRSARPEPQRAQNQAINEVTRPQRSRAEAVLDLMLQGINDGDHTCLKRAGLIS